MEISEIKQRLNIFTVLSHYGLTPSRNGLISCPFHNSDTTPSLKIYEKTNTFHCFGCEASGDQVEFCTLKEGDKHKGILKAMELINSHIGTSAKIATNRAETNNNRIKTINIMDTNLPQTHETLQKAFNFFKESFKTVPKPGNTFKTRGF